MEAKSKRETNGRELVKNINMVATWRKSDNPGIGRKGGEHWGGEERGIDERCVLEWGSGMGCEVKVTRVMIKSWHWPSSFCIPLFLRHIFVGVLVYRPFSLYLDPRAADIFKRFLTLFKNV